MKNYYEILEVSEKASKEIIEKAYRVLSKKYHPDLQEESKKEKSKIKMQEINEAYEILKNDIKREEYDLTLNKSREKAREKLREYEIQKENKEDINSSNIRVKKDVFEEYLEEERLREVQKQQEKIKKEYAQKYENAYENYLKSLGYKIKYKWTWERIRDLLISIVIMVIIGIAIWHFPPTHKLLVDFYNSNRIIQMFFSVMKNIFEIIKNTIIKFFSGFTIYL